jgi:hypothetical protein
MAFPPRLPERAWRRRRLRTRALASAALLATLCAIVLAAARLLAGG